MDLRAKKKFTEDEAKQRAKDYAKERDAKKTGTTTSIGKIPIEVRTVTRQIKGSAPSALRSFAATQPRPQLSLSLISFLQPGMGHVVPTHEGTASEVPFGTEISPEPAVTAA